MFLQYRTILKEPKDPANANDILKWDIDHTYASGTNTLGLVTFGIVLGITLGKMGESGKHLLQFFDCLAKATMQITSWVIW